MRFAIKTRPEHTTWRRMRDIWTAADEIDLFESAWNWDHFYPLTGDMAGPNYEGWTMLAAMAEATERIRIGCQVTGMVYRHPAVLANMAATVDVISDGRLEIGVGAAWNQMECDAYGIELPPLTERFDRFDEGVEAIIALLSEPEANFSGRYVRLRDARCEPKPVQQPHPPITIGGKGPKRTLRAAARWAQQWNTIVATPEEWTSLRDVLEEHCAAVGRDPAEITCSINVGVNGPDDISEAVERASSFGAVGVDLVVINLPHDHGPELLEPIASAFEEIA
ncbi:MAG: TIGR03560 family F420-dependent LLM class oxidoreductase [Acidimicrobiales bacterium]